MASIPYFNTVVIFLSSFYFLCTLPFFSSSPCVQAIPYISLLAAGIAHTNWDLNTLDVRLYNVKLPDTKLDGFKFLWLDPYTDR